jgi:hypothetical protein
MHVERGKCGCWLVNTIGAFDAQERLPPGFYRRTRLVLTCIQYGPSLL